MGAVSRSEAGHGNTDNAFAVVTETVEGTHANQQGQCRIETATDTDDDVLTIGMNESLGQSGCLNIQNLLARLCHLIILRNKGMGVDGTSEFERMLILSGLRINNQSMSVALGIDECAVGVTLRTQTLDINLSLLQLGLE